MNGAPGSVTIGAPALYVPGSTVAISVTIQDSSLGRRRWGFEMAARFKNNGNQAENPRSEICG